MLGRFLGSILLLGGFALAFFNRLSWGDLAIVVMLLGIGVLIDTYLWQIVQAVKQRPPQQ